MVVAVGAPAVADGLLSWVRAPGSIFRALGVEPQVLPLGRLIARERPAVLVIDAAMAAGEAAALLVLAADVGVGVLVMHPGPTPADEVDWVRAGARAVAAMDISRSAFRRLMREVADGHVIMSSDALALFANGSPVAQPG